MGNTKRKIADGLLEMLHEKPLRKITVQDIMDCKDMMYKGEKMSLAVRHAGKEAAYGEGEGDCDEGDPGEGGNAVHEGAPLQREGGKQ